MQGNGNAALGLVGLALVVLLPALATGNPLEESLQLLALARETTRLLGRDPDGHAPLATGKRTMENPGGDIPGSRGRPRGLPRRPRGRETRLACTR